MRRRAGVLVLVAASAVFAASFIRMATGATVASAASLDHVTAHVEVVSSDPEPGAVLDKPPDTVAVTFTEPVSAASTLEILDAGFQRMDVGVPHADPANQATLVIGLSPKARGDLTVQYAAADAADGHITQGAFSFTVNGDAASADAPQSTAPAGGVSGTGAPSTSNSGGAGAAGAVAQGATAGTSASEDASGTAAAGRSAEVAPGTTGSGTTPSSPGRLLLWIALGILAVGGAAVWTWRGTRGGPACLAAAAIVGLTLSVVGCGSGDTSAGTAATGAATAGSVEGSGVAPTEVSTGTLNAGAEAPSAEGDLAAGGTVSGAGAEPVSIVIAASDLGVGHDRFAFAILDSEKVLVQGATAKVTFYHIDGASATPVAEQAATFYPGVIDPAGLYVAYLDFDRAGQWGAAIEGTMPDGHPMADQRVSFTVQPHSKAPAVGDAPPPTENRTTTDPAELPQITSDPNPDPDFYKMTVSEAAASGKPTVIVFATPAYCTSRLCGPVLDEVKGLKDGGWADRVNFIHIEVYGSFEPLELSPIMDQWGLVTEPWVYVLGSDGRVAERLEGSASARELEPILERVTGAS